MTSKSILESVFGLVLVGLSGWLLSLASLAREKLAVDAKVAEGSVFALKFFGKIAVVFVIAIFVVSYPIPALSAVLVLTIFTAVALIKVSDDLILKATVFAVAAGLGLALLFVSLEPSIPGLFTEESIRVVVDSGVAVAEGFLFDLVLVIEQTAGLGGAGFGSYPVAILLLLALARLLHEARQQHRGHQGHGLHPVGTV